jgi:hypothetical protein
MLDRRREGEAWLDNEACAESEECKPTNSSLPTGKGPAIEAALRHFAMIE